MVQIFVLKWCLNRHVERKLFNPVKRLVGKGICLMVQLFNFKQRNSERLSTLEEISDAFWELRPEMKFVRRVFFYFGPSSSP